MKVNFTVNGMQSGDKLRLLAQCDRVKNKTGRSMPVHLHSDLSGQMTNLRELLGCLPEVLRCATFCFSITDIRLRTFRSRSYSFPTATRRYLSVETMPSSDLRSKLGSLSARLVQSRAHRFNENQYFSATTKSAGASNVLRMEWQREHRLRAHRLICFFPHCIRIVYPAKVMNNKIF